MASAGITPDTWQANVLRTFKPKTLLLCSRQSGKSTTAAAMAILAALLEAPALVLLLSPTQRQSGELFRDKVLRLYHAIPDHPAIVQQSALQMEIAGGSRIVSLPGDEETIRGYSGVNLLILDEAARIPDELYFAVRPMLAVSGGRLVALSTPFGKRGWFWEAWHSAADWNRVKVAAEDCPRIKPDFLAGERLDLGPSWFRQEYECSFESMEGAEWPAEYFPDSIWFDDWPGKNDITITTLALDPSKGKDAKSGDYAAYVVLKRDREGTLWCEAQMAKGVPTPRLVDEGLELCRIHQPDGFAIETNQFQSLLAVEIERVSRERGVMLPIHCIDNRVNKEVRIRRLGPYLARHNIRFKNTPGTRLLVAQLQEFPEGPHDDGNDSLEMCLRLMVGLWNGKTSNQPERLRV